ncbi:MAG: hypothetical protein P1P63_04845 [Treponemataceae bacterium]
MLKEKRRRNNFGWKKAFSLYSKKYFWKASILPLILTSASFLVSVQSSKSPIFYIRLLSETILDISPGVIGFLLSGYAIIIGFSSNEVVRFMSKKSDTSDKTLYQRQNAVFAVSIFSLLVGLVIAIFVNFILKAEINYFHNDIAANIFNNCILLLLLYVIYFSVFSIKDMIINVFNFGQMIHYLMQKQINNKNNETH